MTPLAIEIQPAKKYGNYIEKLKRPAFTVLLTRAPAVGELVSLGDVRWRVVEVVHVAIQKDEPPRVIVGAEEVRGD